MATDFDTSTIRDHPRLIQLIAGIVLAVLSLGAGAPAIDSSEPTLAVIETVALDQSSIASSTATRRHRSVMRRLLGRSLQRLGVPTLRHQLQTQRVPRRRTLSPPLWRGPPARLV